MILLKQRNRQVYLSRQAGFYDHFDHAFKRSIMFGLRIISDVTSIDQSAQDNVRHLFASSNQVTYDVG